MGKVPAEYEIRLELLYLAQTREVKMKGKCFQEGTALERTERLVGRCWCYEPDVE